MDVKDQQRDDADRSYQRNFFPLVPYTHNLLAGLVGALVGCAYAVASGNHYFEAIVGGALLAQIALGAFAIVRDRMGERARP